MTKQEAIAIVTENKFIFKKITKFHDDIDVAKAAITPNGLNLAYVDQALKDNKELTMLAINENYNALKYISSTMRDDIDIDVWSKAIRHNIQLVKYAPKTLKESMGDERIIITKTVTETISSIYECEVKIPKHILLSDEFKEYEYFDEESAVCAEEGSCEFEVIEYGYSIKQNP